MRFGFWSRIEAADGEGYVLRHEVAEYAGLPSSRAVLDTVRLEGEPAAEPIRRIYRADTVSWTCVGDGAASRPHPVTSSAKWHLRNLMNYCRISHEPAPWAARSARGSRPGCNRAAAAEGKGINAMGSSRV